MGFHVQTSRSSDRRREKLLPLVEMTFFVECHGLGHSLRDRLQPNLQSKEHLRIAKQDLLFDRVFEIHFVEACERLCQVDVRKIGAE